MKLADRKKNLDVLVGHFKKHPHILKAMKDSPEDVAWLHAHDHGSDLEAHAEKHKGSMKQGPISSLEELKETAKEKAKEEKKGEE